MSTILSQQIKLSRQSLKNTQWKIVATLSSTLSHLIIISVEWGEKKNLPEGVMTNKHFDRYLVSKSDDVAIGKAICC
jgi:hypothetical protein